MHKKDAHKINQYQNNLVKITIFSILSLVLLIILSCFIYLFAAGIPGIRYIFSATWDPSSSHYGMLPFLLGTLTVTLLSLLIAVPVAIGTTFFVNEFCSKKIKKIINVFTDLLSGLPSVILGFFAFVVLNKFITFSLMLAAIILAFMIMPLIMSYMNISLEHLPDDYRLASYSLGANKIETTYKIIFKYCIPSLRAGILVAISRAIGETMAVTLIIGGSTALPDFLNFWNGFLYRSGSTFTSIIITNFQEALGVQKQVLMMFGVMILIIVTLCNMVAFAMQKKALKKYG